MSTTTVSRPIHYSVFTDLQDPLPAAVDGNWNDLVGYLTTHRVSGVKQGPGWSPAVYGDKKHRNNSNVIEVTCLVLDFDGKKEVEDWKFLDGLEHVVHSTYSHTEEEPSYRVIIPLEKPIPAREWPGFWAAALQYLGVIQYACPCKAVSQFYYSPTARPGAPAFTRAKSGQWLDPDTIWDHCIEEAPVKRPRSNKQVYDVEPRILQMALSRAPQGRNNACFWLCVQCRDNGMSEADCLRLVMQFINDLPPSQDKGVFTEREALRTLKSAFMAPARDAWTTQSDMMLSAKNLATRLAQEKDWAVSVEFMSAMRAYRRAAPLEFSALADTASAQCSNWYDRFSSFSDAADDAEENPDDDDFAPVVGNVISNWLPDAYDPKMIIPSPWQVREGSVGMSVQSQRGEEWQKVFHGPVQVVGRAWDRRGQIKLCLAWRQGNSPWKTAIVPRDEALTALGLAKLAAEGFPWREKNRTLAADYIASVENANLARMPSVVVSARLGWQGAPGQHAEFLLPNGVIVGGELIRSDDFNPNDPSTWKRVLRTTFMPLDAGAQQIGAAVSSSGTIASWKEVLSLATHLPRPMALVLAALATPLLEIVGCPSFGIELHGRTSTGKTTSARLAASVWGSPDERRDGSFLNHWDVTSSWQSRACAVRSGFPLILDGSERANAAKGGNFGEIVHSIATGRGRGRATVGGLMEGEYFTACLISTGEQALTSFSTNGGVRTRMLEIDGQPLGESSINAARLARDISIGSTKYYGTAGPLFVRWLQRNFRHSGDWVTEWRRLSDTYASSGVSVESSRLADYAAILSLTHTLARQAGVIPEDSVDPMPELWHSISLSGADASGAEGCLERVLAFWQQNPSRFIKPNQMVAVPGIPIAGIETRKAVSFYRPELEKMILGWGYSPPAIFSEWISRKMIAVNSQHARPGPTVVITFKQQSHRVVSIPMEVIETFIPQPDTFEDEDPHAETVDRYVEY